MTFLCLNLVKEKKRKKDAAPGCVVFTPIIGFFRKKLWHAHEVQKGCFLKKIWGFFGTWEHNTNNGAGISSTHLFFFS